MIEIIAVLGDEGIMVRKFHIIFHLPKAHDAVDVVPVISLLR
jgi:hypothetical protein